MTTSWQCINITVRFKTISISILELQIIEYSSNAVSNVMQVKVNQKNELTKRLGTNQWSLGSLNNYKRCFFFGLNVQLLSQKLVDRRQKNRTMNTKRLKRQQQIRQTVMMVIL
jgi:hypothetical protein